MSSRGNAPVRVNASQEKNRPPLTSSTRDYFLRTTKTLLRPALRLACHLDVRWSLPDDVLQPAVGGWWGNRDS